MPKPVVHVAIALLYSRGRILVGWRQAQQHQGNKYEFPGGKVETNETPEAACRREIYEEVGVGLSNWQPFCLLCHEYEDISVHLHVFSACVPHEMLNQIQKPWSWYTREQLLTLNFPAANRAILERLYWPHLIKISAKLEMVEQSVDDRLFYWRPEPADTELSLLKLEQGQLHRLILPHRIWQALAVELQAQVAAVHLKQSEVMSLKKGELKVGVRYIAACHDAVSLQQAQQIGCDAVLISPVLTTATHPQAQPLGWEGFAELSQQSDIPVFALGGLTVQDLSIAQQYGAYGIAGIRYI